MFLYKIFKGWLWTISIWPLPVLYVFSDFICFFVRRCYRTKVVRENLRTAFPEKSGAELKDIERKFYHHLPGAVFAAAGWMLFSYFYSLYTTYFTGVSYIYGSLTAVVLLLLWMYVCMIILLIGAELNKLIAGSDRKEKIRKADEQDEHPETAD